MITLYDYALSGNCYKLRLLMHWLDLAYETQQVDFYPGFEHKSEDFLKLNPLGQLPVLVDDELVLRDAQAILVYLARKYDKTKDWYPVDDPDRLGQVSMWLAFADNITGTASAARLHDAMYFNLDVEQARTGAHKLFRILDEHLWFAEQSGQQWIISGDAPTIADIACFPYTLLAPEGGIRLDDYPAIRRWGDKLMNLPDFISMPGLSPVAPGLVSSR